MMMMMLLFLLGKGGACVKYVRDLGWKYWKEGLSMGGWLRDGRGFVAIKARVRSLCLLFVEYWILCSFSLC